MPRWEIQRQDIPMSFLQLPNQEALATWLMSPLSGLKAFICPDPKNRGTFAYRAFMGVRDGSSGGFTVISFAPIATTSNLALVEIR